MAYHSAMKEDRPLMPQIDESQHITLSDRSHTHKSAYCVILLTRSSRVDGTSMW